MMFKKILIGNRGEITWEAPKIGSGNAVFFVPLGQLSVAVAIDHFGLRGAAQGSVSGKRAFGIAVMAVGVYLALKPV